MIDLWHKSVDLKPTREAMEKVLQSMNITMTETGNNSKLNLVMDVTIELKLYYETSRSINTCTIAGLEDSAPLLRDDDYTCDTDVMVDGDVFTYPYRGYRPVRAVKILQPMTPTQNYFEHKIVSPGIICAITIGVVGCDYVLDAQPGWCKDGIGYHADDGLLYNESGEGKPFGPTCTIGDRMGCGVDFESEDSSGYVNVFFTKNGEQVGNFVKFRKLKSGLYPLIGMESQGEQFQYLGRWNHLPKEGKNFKQ